MSGEIHRYAEDSAVRAISPGRYRTCRSPVQRQHVDDWSPPPAATRCGEPSRERSRVRSSPRTDRRPVHHVGAIGGNPPR